MKYFLIEVEDDEVDDVQECIDYTFVRSMNIKQVVLDGIEFDEAERVTD